MLQDDFKILGEGSTKLASYRKAYVHSTHPMSFQEDTEFVIRMGRTCILQGLEVNRPCLIKAYSTAERDDTNPYAFLAYKDHLKDDGTTRDSLGVVWGNRRYTILSNDDMVPSENIYWTVKCLDTFGGVVDLMMNWLVMEN